MQAHLSGFPSHLITDPLILNAFESNLKNYLLSNAFSITGPCSVASLHFWVSFADAIVKFQYLNNYSRIRLYLVYTDE